MRYKEIVRVELKHIVGFSIHSIQLYAAYTYGYEEIFKLKNLQYDKQQGDLYIFPSNVIVANTTSYVLILQVLD